MNKHVNALTGIRGSILSSSPDRNQVTIVGDVSPNYLCLSLGDWSQVSNEKRPPGCLGFFWRMKYYPVMCFFHKPL